MKVIVADALGFCFGVRDALEMTRRIADPRSVTIHGELVHNETVLRDLRGRGFGMTAESERAQLPDTATVLITAHGISDAERARLQASKKQLIDTTCPLVRRAHRAAQALADEGRHVVVIGRPEHVEVVGIVEDLPSFDVIDSVAGARDFGEPRLGIICQTTTPPRLAEQISAAIRQANPKADIRQIDTICQPTQDRQEAVERLLDLVDAMVVVGGRNSNNTRELVSRCRERGIPSWHIESAQEIRADWFRGDEAVGLTAGTSTPDALIREVYEALLGLYIMANECTEGETTR